MLLLCEATMRARDVAIVVVCTVASIVAWLQEGSLSVIPGFHIHLYDSGAHRYIPRPIVTDLDGNGSPEVLLLRQPTELSVVQTSVIHGRTQMALRLDDSRTENLYGSCIGLATGFISFPDQHDASDFSASTSRKLQKMLMKQAQHVAVVTNDYKLSLYDANLTLMWTVSLVESSMSYMVPRTASVVVLPDRVFDHDRGVVIVGVKAMSHGAAPVTVFSAHDGATGARRWRHAYGSDVHTQSLDVLPDGIMSLDTWKLSEKELSEHSNNLPWTHFRDSVVATLPHSYTHPWDGRLTPLHLTHAKNRKKRAPRSDDDGKGKQHQRTVRTEDDATGTLGDRLARASRHQGKRRRRPLPNTLAVHGPEGVTILHLFTGRAVTSVSPLRRGSVYDDVNDDGRIDVLSAVVGPRQEFFGRHGIKEEWQCDARIATNVPGAEDTVFSAGICDTEGYFAGLSQLRRLAEGDGADVTTESQVGGHDPLSLIGSHNVADKNTLATTPLVLRQRRSKGHHMLEVEPVALFLVSGGHVTAVNAKRRRVEWRLDTEADFSGMLTGHGDAEVVGTANDDAFDKEDSDSAVHGLPHLVAYTFTARYHDPADVRSAYWARHRHDPVAIAVGARRIVMIDTVHGRTVATVDLPAAPVAPAIVADFNGDGINDLIVFTRKGYFGYVVQRHVSGSTTSLLMLITVACVGLLAVAKRWEEYSAGDADADHEFTFDAAPKGDRAEVLARRAAKRATD